MILFVRIASLLMLTSVVIVQSLAAAGWWVLPAGPAAVSGFAVLACALGVYAARESGTSAPAVSTLQTAATAGITTPSEPPGIYAGKPDRRAYRRYPVTKPVVVEVRGMPATNAEFRDISEGGARIANGPSLAPGTQGVLRIDGVKLAVPFEVVSEAGSRELRVKFDLQGMARDAFLRQFDRLLRSPEQDAAAETGDRPVNQPATSVG